MVWPNIQVECMFSSPTWTDISAWVQEVNIKRGVSRVDSPLLRYEAGTAEIKLDNRDRRFDPTNLQGPYTSGFAADTGLKTFVATKAQEYGFGYTLALPSAVGQIASVVNTTSAASGTTGSWTCPKPSGTLSGHKMIAVIISDVGTVAQQTISGGASWGTKLHTSTYGESTLQVSIWHKTAGGSEPSNYTFGQNSGADGVAFIITARDVNNAVTPVFDWLENINASEHQTPGISPTGSNDLEIRFVAAAWPDGLVSWTSPPVDEGYTEYVDKQSQTYTNVAVAIRQLSGVTGSGTDTLVLPNRPIRVKVSYPFTATTNYVRNPSFEEGVTSWSGGNPQSSVTSTMLVSRFGGSALKLERTATDPVFNLYAADGLCAAGPTTGQTIAISAYVYLPAASYDKVSGISFTGAGIASTFVTKPTASDGWYRVSLTKTLTANLANLNIQFWTDNTHSDGQTIAYLDGVQVELAGAVSNYCDGSQPACSWSGTAHNSSSSRPSSFVFNLYSGFVDNWLIEFDADFNSVANVPCTDGFKLLAGNSRPAVAAVGAGENSGARINRILDSAGWPIADRLISTGDVSLQATTLEGEALAELTLVSDTEIGELYIDEQGRIVFRNREAVLSDTRAINVQARFGDGGETKGEFSYQDVGINNDAQQIANSVRITRVGGTPQVSEDADSIAEISRDIPQTFERDDLIMQTDAEAKSYADWILYIASKPELRFESLQIKPQIDEDALFPQVLGRQIGDRIEIHRRPVGEGDPIVREVFIRGVEHNIRQWEWETTFALQSATKVGNFLTLNHPTLGIIGENALTP